MTDIWKIKALGKVCSISSSKRIYRDEYVEEGIPFYRGKEIILKANNQEIKDTLYITNERYTQIKERFDVPIPGDILLTSVGTLGVPYVVKCGDEFYFKDGNITWFSDYREEVDNIFLYYWLTSPQMKNQILASHIGVAQPALTIVGLKSFKIQIPPLPTQRKIAGILSAYDDLIENNTRRIKILEEMAQRIYREWFVDFRYPGYENDKLVESELGPIPEGWEVKEFGDVFDVKYGKGLPTKDLLEYGIFPVYGAGSVIGYYNKLVYDKKVTLITCRGNGSGTVWRTREPAFITNNSFLIIPKEIFTHFKYHFVEQLCLNSNINSVISGSAQPQITITNLATIKCLTPDKKTIGEYCHKFGLLIETIDILFKQNQTLRQTRDLLLPKLISGKVDVSKLKIRN